MGGTVTHIEVWGASGPRLVPVQGVQMSIGRGADRDVKLEDDAKASRAHAVIEAVAGSWVLRDLGSQNGTRVNGDLLTGDRALRSGDQIVCGDTRLVFRDDEPSDGLPPTVRGSPPPELTRREREVLVALCRPLLLKNTFSQPASVRQVAGELVVTEAAVRQHLLNLYGKFELFDEEADRRSALATDAILRGAVKVSDLRANPPTSAPT